VKILCDIVGFIRITHISPYLITALLLLAFLKSGEVYGAAGDLLWQDLFNLEAGSNEARTVAAEGNRIFAGGFGQQSNGQAAWVLRASRADTGELLWDDVFNPGGGNASVFGVFAADGRVYAAGGGDDASGGSLWVVRAYDAGSGEIVWEDLFQNGGRFANAQAIAADNNRVYAGGRADNVSGRSEWVVRTYDSSTGDLVWQDRFGVDGKDEGAFAVAVTGNVLFVSGGASNPLIAGDWLVRAYDAGTGEVLWGDQLGAPDGFFVSLSIAARDGRVFAAGIGKTLAASDWIVRAYDAVSGDLLWEDRFDTGLGEGAVSIIANESGVFATGGIASPAEGNAMVVKSYDPADGDVRWEDRVEFDADGGTGGTSIVTLGDIVYAAGSGAIDSIVEWIVISYNGQTGEILWENQFDLGGGVNIPFAAAALKNRVYAVGAALAEEGIDNIWIVRAYEANGGGGESCSIAPVMPEPSIPLYLLLPALILIAGLRLKLRN
jgi:hypothetical protein